MDHTSSDNSKKSIQVLDPSVVHQLRSSVVISTLPQCLKELIANAIDAEATHIDILIDIEKFSLQVNDNGFGILNMNQIGKRHVSSKCHSLSDISQLKTFGFRGEALAAITNEAFVHIISRSVTSKETFEAFWRDGNIVGNYISSSKRTRKIQPGTSIIVRDLFYKFPVRRRYLASTAYQHVVMMESVKRLIINFALCFQNINFTLVDKASDTKILTVKNSKTSLDVFRQLFGQELTQYVKNIIMHEDNVKLNGFFSTTGYPNKTHQYIYVNNFLIPSNNQLYKTVADLFATSDFIKPLRERQELVNSTAAAASKNKAHISVQKYPIFLIKIECPNWSYYEINSYLDIFTEFSSFHDILALVKKFTVKFLTTSNLLSTNTTAIGSEKEAGKKRKRPSIINLKRKDSPYLVHSSYASSSIFEGSSNSTITGQSSSIIQSENGDMSKYITWWDEISKNTFYIDRATGNSYLSPPTSSNNSHTQNIIDRSHLKRTKLNLDNHLGSNIRNRELLHQNHVKIDQGATLNPQKLSKSNLQNCKVVCQVDKKYIVVKSNSENSKSKLLLIDQHAADERVKLEEMLRSSFMNSIITLEPSICLELESEYDYWILTDSRTLKYLKSWGITIANSKTNGNSIAGTICHGSKSSHLIQNSKEHLVSLQTSRQKNKVYVTQLPYLIIDRCTTNHTLLKDLIKEYAYWLNDQKNDETIIKRSCPKGIMEILKSRACRSAIMFNDSLNLIECETVVKKLSNCNFPFQCAHGRPTIVPTSIYLESMTSTNLERKVNWSRFLL